MGPMGIHVISSLIPSGTMHRTLMSICSAWNNCSAHVGHEGCTFDDLITQVMQYSSWIHFKSHDVIQRYKEATDSLRHLCNNIEPGTNTRHSVPTDYIEDIFILSPVFSYSSEERLIFRINMAKLNTAFKLKTTTEYSSDDNRLPDSK